MTTTAPDPAAGSELPSVGRYVGPPPVVHPETEPYWLGLGAGRFLLQRCERCGTTRFPVAPICWACLSPAAQWVDVPTSGTVAAAVTVHRALGDPSWGSEVPFVVAQVDLSDGLRVPGRLVDADPEHPPPRGTAVRAARLDADDGVGVLCFVTHSSEEDA